MFVEDDVGYASNDADVLGAEDGLGDAEDGPGEDVTSCVYGLEDSGDQSTEGVENSFSALDANRLE